MVAGATRFENMCVLPVTYKAGNNVKWAPVYVSDHVSVAKSSLAACLPG